MSGGFFSVFKRWNASASDTTELKIGLARVMEYNDLKKATNNFETELGRGGFGRVYKGTLKNGQKVAVKVLVEHDRKVVEQFLNEVTVLSRLRHKNLVSLIGCTTPRGRELLLVYELVSNGTVYEHLHHQRDLTWARRFAIAVETADAIAYLHAQQPLIIHRDVKTENILLDENFQVKLADLGICRFLPWDAAAVSTMPQGTQGYRDPEYDRCFRLSDKTDVYSFGIVLMELISGQKAVDVERQDIYLHEMVSREIANNKLEELVDPTLGYHSNRNVRRMIDAAFKVAGECLRPVGTLRPPMAQVLKELKELQQEMQQRGPHKFDANYSDSPLDSGGGGREENILTPIKCENFAILRTNRLRIPTKQPLPTPGVDPLPLLHWI